MDRLVKCLLITRASRIFHAKGAKSQTKKMVRVDEGL